VCLTLITFVALRLQLAVYTNKIAVVVMMTVTMVIVIISADTDKLYKAALP